MKTAKCSIETKAAEDFPQQDEEEELPEEPAFHDEPFDSAASRERAKIEEEDKLTLKFLLNPEPIKIRDPESSDEEIVNVSKRSVIRVRESTKQEQIDETDQRGTVESGREAAVGTEEKGTGTANSSLSKNLTKAPATTAAE